MNTSVLFVDDDPSVLAGLKRLLRTSRRSWTVDFAISGEEALCKLAATPFDVVVSDMRMPQMDGSELLTVVRARYPRVVRIILSGHSERESILRAIGPTHQYLAKPCDPETLLSTITRALALLNLLDEPRLTDAISGLNQLPSMPDSYREMMSEVQSPNASVKKIAAIIARDPGMTAMILRLVNSAYFGLSQRVNDAGQAVTLLGLSTVSALVLSAHVFAEADPGVAREFDFDGLWRHSVRVGIGARAIMRHEVDDGEQDGQAFTAGTLHDVGRLILGSRFRARYRAVMESSHGQQRPLEDLELDEFGATHAEIGAYVLGLWGLPSPIVEAVAYHHTPGQSFGGEFSPLIAVHAADAIDRSRQGSSEPPLDMAVLRRFGVAHRVEEWRTLLDTCAPAGA